MKIEKLDENKIKITINNKDLEENHITFHSFMSNSIESQKIFLTLLDKAKKEIGFITDDYTISIETLILNNENFILIITRFRDQNNLKTKPKLHYHRKRNTFSNSLSLYKFESLNDFYNFCTYLKYIFPEIIEEFNEKNSLYEYNNYYYLNLNDIKQTINSLKFCVFIAEFASFVRISKISFQKFIECGNLIIENNAITKYISNS